MNPFRKFDRIVVINLKRCPERLEQFKKQAKEYEFDFEVFEAIEHEIGSYGCSLSHFEIIKKAKADNLKNVLVFEDDAVFLYPKKYVWQSIKKYFSEKCDVFYLGSNLVWECNQKYSRCLGRFALIYNASSFNYLIDNMPSFEEFQSDRSKRGDVFLAHSTLKKAGCKIPVVAVDSEKSFTGTNAMPTLFNPLDSGKEHFSLILAGYHNQNLVDIPNLKPEYILKSASVYKGKYTKKINELANLNPFDFIDEIRCINLDSDVERWNDMEKVFKEHNIKCKRFNAIRNKNGWAGSTLSHRACIQEAKEKGLRNVLIFEDDVFFLHDPEKVKEMLRNAFSVKDFDILYLGLTLRDFAENVSENLYRVKKGWGVYAYLVNHTAFDRLLDLMPETPEKITHEKKTVSDVLIWEHVQPSGKCYLVPLMASADNYSHNWGKQRSETVKTIKEGYQKYLKQPETNQNEYKKALSKFSESSGIIKSYVINLDDQKERLISFSKNPTKLISQRIKPIEISDSKIQKAVKITNPQWPAKAAKFFSNQFTFSEILKKETDDKIIIFEDDAVLSHNFDNMLDSILSELPDDFAICFLGYYLRRNTKLKKYSEHLIEIMENTVKIVGAHGIIYNKSIYSDLSKALSKTNSLPTDSQICETLTGKKRCFIVDPMICKQSGAESSLSHKLNLRRFERDNLRIISEVKP